MGVAWRVRNGQLYQIGLIAGPRVASATSLKTTVMMTQGPVAGGEQRVLYSEVLAADIQVLNYTNADDGAWLHLLTGYPQGIPHATIPVEVGEYRLPTTPIRMRPGDTLQIKPEPAVDPKKKLPAHEWLAIRLTHSGAKQTIVVQPAGHTDNISCQTALNNQAFWCENGSQRTQIYTTKKQGLEPTLLKAFLYPPQGRLYRRALLDGSPQLLADNLTLPPNSSLIPLEDGVALYQYRDYPDKRRDLLIFRAPDYRPVRLPNYRGQMALGVAQGRLWWIEEGAISVETPRPVSYLVSATFDGGNTERRLLTEDAQGSAIHEPQLSIFNDRIYLGYITENIKDSGNAEEQRMRSRLALVKPEPELVIQPFLKSTARVDRVESDWVDGDYFYFVSPEIQRNVLDFLSSRTTVREIPCLFRIRLPK